MVAGALAPHFNITPRLIGGAIDGADAKLNFAHLINLALDRSVGEGVAGGWLGGLITFASRKIYDCH